MKNFFKKIDIFFSDDSRKIKKNDIIIIAVLLIIYSIISFSNLGSTKSPQTFVQLGPTKSATFEIRKDVEISKLRYFSGDEVGTYIFATSEDGVTYTDLGEFKPDYCFCWYDFEINKKFKYFRISTENNADLGEIQLYDKDSNKVILKAGSDIARKLIDESNTVPEKIGHMNNMMFDEVYFARSAYQYVHGIDVMEWTHPPLRKINSGNSYIFYGHVSFCV